MIEFHQITVGPLGSNCYLLQNTETKEIAIVDPGEEPEVILGAAGKLGGKVVAIWNTHAHIDHINANAPVQEATGAPISIHELEADWLPSAEKTLAVWAGIPFRPSKADHIWRDGDHFEALGGRWSVRHVPGHSPGGCAIICDGENLFVGGDLLFQGSIGRMDLPGGSEEAMRESLRGLFQDWGKDSWRVLPGHGPVTTIANERRSNPFLGEFGL